MLSGIRRDKLKKQAVALRENGESYSAIELELGVSRATLSGWLGKLSLSTQAKKIILKRKQDHLKQACQKAASEHRRIRDEEVEKIVKEVVTDFTNLKFDRLTKEMLLAMLYLGEGFKKRSVVGLGNSNPKIVSVFVELLREIYLVSDNKLRCFLYLRADQNDEKEKRYWSKMLRINVSLFRKSQKDKRTLGKKTYKGYHGVCAVYCYDASIEKRLMAFQEVLLKKLLMGL